MNAWRALVALAALVCVASSHAQSEAPAEPWRYQIQPGDTLISLAGLWLERPRGWRDLQRLNRIVDPRRLKSGSTLQMPVDWLKRDASVAEAVFVKGEVVHQQGTSSAPLAAGATLRSGDRVRTGAQSSASLRFADGSRLLIPPDSEVTLAELLALGRAAIPSVRIDLTKGSADSRVTPAGSRPPLYRVRTPHVNLGVRGTEFRVQITDAASRMQVLSGTVHADGGPGRDVAAGQGLLADAGTRSVSPLLPAPDLAGMKTLVDRLPMRLTWPTGPAGAVAWRAQLFAPGDFDRLLLDARVDQPITTWSEGRDLPDGSYSLRVRGIDANGQEGASADRAVSLQARPEPPFIQAPAPGAVSYAGGIALAWTRNASAPRVRLQVARDPAFADLVPQPDAIDAAGIELRLPDGTYHWRVASIEPGGRVGPFGDPQTFELRPPPPSPPPAVPEVGDGKLTLRWRADPEVVRYELEWANSAEFAGTGVSRFTTDEPALALPVPSPGTYYLRARAFNAAGAVSPWGQTQVVEQPYPRWIWFLPLLLLPLL